MYKKHRTVALVALVIMMALLVGCSATMNAVNNRELAVEAKMSETIFLDAEALTDEPKIFVRVANTSDFQEIDFSQQLIERFGAMGYQVTRKAKEADYLVTANLLYMGEKTSEIDPESMFTAGFGGAGIGALAAATSGSSLRGAGTAGLAVGLASAAGSAVIGGVFHVDEYYGIVDLQVKETVEGGVAGVVKANVQDGSSTSTQTTRNIQDTRQEYRTRIMVKAKQTRMDRTEACGVIMDRLSSQISGIFKI
ncbi:MAG: complement resistance protein TraT [Desulfuromonadales bacterium]|nr:complement resistance protein TraT [Desulfuromonadales bacterium]